MRERRIADDLGDDEQASEIEVVRRYVEDPPEVLEITEPEEPPAGIGEWVAGETHESEPVLDDRPAEEEAVRERERPGP